MANWDIDLQSFDIPREASVYPDRAGARWWTKSWFNGREKGEGAIEVEQELAAAFIQNEIRLDDWLEEFFPKPMEIYHKAIEQTKEQLLGKLRSQAM